jgi:hypothetical protein
MGRDEVSVLSAALCLWYVNGMAISGRSCGPAHYASHHGAPRVVSPRPGPVGPGSLDDGRRDLVGHGRLEEGGMRGT